MSSKIDTYLEYQERFTMSGCMQCSARRSDRECIPKAFYMKGREDAPTLMFVLSRAQEVDEINNRLFSSQEKETFKRWIQTASNGVWPPFVVSAALRCFTEDDRTPKISEIKTCSYKHLWKEINFIQPKTIVTLGEKALLGVKPHKSLAYAKEQMLKRLDTKIVDPDRNISWEGPVYSIYHPAFIQMGQGRQYEDTCVDLMAKAFAENRT